VVVFSLAEGKNLVDVVLGGVMAGNRYSDTGVTKYTMRRNDGGVAKQEESV